MAACQKGLTVGFIAASALVHELLEARDEKRLLRLQKQLTKYRLPIIDELGYVPLSPTGAGSDGHRRADWRPRDGNRLGAKYLSGIWSRVWRRIQK